LTWTPTPVISLETVTGQVRTVTVTPTAPPNAAGTALAATSREKLSTAAAVGLTIGLVALIIGLVLLAFFCWRRREKERNRDGGDDLWRGSRSGLDGPVPSRTMSESSRFVLNTDGRQVVESWEAENVAGTRRSRLMTTVDPRLDPFAKVYQRGLDGKSRESVNTIRDDQDYSRRIRGAGPILRAVNPDPEPSHSFDHPRF
jgi:cell wall integrity and stress response component